MGGSESKVDADDTIQGGAAARAAAFTAPPLAVERFMGLNNFGNTCYCNATIQALYFCTPLRQRCCELQLVYEGKRSVAEQLKLDAPHLQIERERRRAAQERHAPARAAATADSDADDAGHASDGSEDLRTAASTPAPSGRRPVPDNKPADSVLMRMCELFSSLDQQRLAPKKPHFGPKAFVSKVKAENVMFNNTQQQDAHEFAIFVLSTIVDDEKTLLGIPAAEPSFLQYMLTGQSIARTCCGECDTVTNNVQTFMDVNLDVCNNASMRYCAELYSSYETMAGEDKFRCEACTSPVEARRRLLFLTLPTVLVIQLKRFSYVERIGGYAKRNDRFAFTVTTSVPLVDGTSERYQLSGVVIHQGATPHLGHYVALGYSDASHRWYKCDDETVTHFAERDLQRYFGACDALNDATAASTATAYLLIYSLLPSQTSRE